MRIGISQYQGYHLTFQPMENHPSIRLGGVL